MADGPRVSLLLPNRDNGTILDVVLERLATNTTYPDVELVAVDDGSTDNSREVLRRWRDSGRFAGFNLIEKEHSGVIETLNAGLHAATGEIVVQLDADASVETHGWVERMLEFFLSDDRIGLVTAKVIIDTGIVHALGVNLIGPDGLHDRGSRPTEPTGRRTLHSRVARVREGESPLEARIAEVDSGIGCCMMYRREDALSFGGYDDGFAPVWFDDLDVCLSIRRLGKKAFYLPDVRVLHRLSARAAAAPKPTAPRERAVAALRRRSGALVPPHLREAIGRRLGLDKPSPAHLERLRHHYAYWQEKWGWDPLRPDMDAIEARYGDTELWWARDPDRRRAGEEIVRAFEAKVRAAA
jgi:GT2 family glycosyltransferase